MWLRIEQIKQTGETGRGQLTLAPIGHSEESGFYSQCTGKISEIC